MKYLIFGSSGMLGSAFLRQFEKISGNHVVAPVRGTLPEVFKSYSSIEFIPNTELAEGTLLRLLDEHQPDVILNCVGYVKQRKFQGADHLQMLWVNSVFPHILANWSVNSGCKLITFSTDCVFDGKIGNYVEQDQPTPVDYYGVTKLAGEVNDGDCLTLRTSIIGPEIRNKLSLLEWFIGAEGVVSGYTEAIYTGLPTRFLADFILRNMESLKQLSGVYHLSSSKISKFDLLSMFNETMGLNKKIIADDSLRIDRSLNSSRIKSQLGIEVPDWPALIEILKDDFNELR